MDNKQDYMVLFGLDGIVDTADESKYTYKQYIVDCFRETFAWLDIPDDKIIWNSKTWALSNHFRILTKDKADYEEFIRLYIEWVLQQKNVEVTEEIHTEFIKQTKIHFKKLTIYQDIVDYMEKLRKACAVGIITDKDWFGCAVINSVIVDHMFDYVQHYWSSNCFKDSDDAWNIVIGLTGKERSNILVVDTSSAVIEKVRSLGFLGYQHIEGDLIGLSKEVNKFLSSRGVNTK